MQYDAIESVIAVAYLNTMSIGDGNDIIIYQDNRYLEENGHAAKKNFPFRSFRFGKLFLLYRFKNSKNQDYSLNTKHLR